MKKWSKKLRNDDCRAYGVLSKLSYKNNNNKNNYEQNKILCNFNTERSVQQIVQKKQ